MKSSQALRRLLRLRALEEEQSRLALEAAQAQEQRLESALAESRRSERRSRESIFESVRSGNAMERLAGLVESRESERVSERIVTWKAEAKESTARRREAFLAGRLERRQTEQMVENAAAEAAAQQERRAQGALDDWHRRQHRPAKKDAAPSSNRAQKTRSGPAAGDAAGPDLPF
jgi:hypothetical protein